MLDKESRGEQEHEEDSVSVADISDHADRLLLDPSHKIILIVQLESYHSNRARHLAIISSPVLKSPTRNKYNLLNEDNEDTHISETSTDSDENPRFSPITRTSSARIKMERNHPASELDYCLLGIDSYMRDGEKRVSLGFVIKMLLGSTVSLDGDGGFGLHVLSKHYIFKPVTLQGLWTAIQTLYAISARLRPKRHSLNLQHTDWVTAYKDSVSSPQSAINEWNEMPDILSRRPMSPDELSRLSSEASDSETRKCVIKSRLREIMKTVDLDEVTSKAIRIKLEKDLNQDLEEFKAFIDEEILLILGQMDPASKIFDFMFLGSEWNASNLEELNANGITHILNVTREIDNFFPAVFKYLNIREWDVEETDLLKYWDETFTFIQGCLDMRGKVLIHCKMGISRSASTVCAFAMKKYGWNLDHTLGFVKGKRGVVNPNQGFRRQLLVYEGILEASRQRHTFRKLHRSKSDGSVKGGRGRGSKKSGEMVKSVKSMLNLPSEPCLSTLGRKQEENSALTGRRPVSWSPPNHIADEIMSESYNESPAGPAVGPLTPIGTSSSINHSVCHCFSALSSQLCCPPVRGPSPAQPLHAINPLYCLPTKEDVGTPESGSSPAPSSPPVNPPSSTIVSSSTACPATPQSHITQCTCNFEMELQVSEAPVDVSSPLCSSDQSLLRQLGTLPIHLRNTNLATATHPNIPPQPINQQHWINSTEADPSQEQGVEDIGPTFSDLDIAVIQQNNQTLDIQLDTAGAEELSVKTLADMFDFRLGEMPSKPPLPTPGTGAIARQSNINVERLARQLAGMEPLNSLQSEC